MAQKSLYDELVRIKKARLKNSEYDNNKQSRSGFRDNRRFNNEPEYMKPFKDVMSLLGDGVDHINVWTGAETDLGMVLDHAGPLPLNHHVFGFFDNMTSFWFYLQSVERDDRIRRMTPQAAFKFSKKLTFQKVLNFKAIIADSNWQRIKSKPILMNLLKKSTLPFDAYMVNPETGFRTRPAFFGWLVWSFEEIRRAVKEDREPNFNEIMDRKDSDIYDFAVRHLQHPNNSSGENRKNTVSENLLKDEHSNLYEKTEVPQSYSDAIEVIPDSIPEVALDNNQATPVVVHN